ncbi:MAG: hypothetical protein ACLTR6_03720 [Clostridium fessum]
MYPSGNEGQRLSGCGYFHHGTGTGSVIRAGGIDFSELPDTPFDDPFGEGSGAGLIFSATGGVMEAALAPFMRW